MIIYIDEAGMDNHEVYDSGWGLKGERLYYMKPGERSHRISIIGGLNNNNFIAPLVFEGYTNSAVFITYLKNVLVPVLIKGQTVVMDNAAFHKGSDIEKVIEKAGCFLKYLPPYSPDLNPIEHHWHALKNAFRKNLKTYSFDLFKVAQLVFAPAGLV